MNEWLYSALYNFRINSVRSNTYRNRDHDIILFYFLYDDDHFILGSWFWKRHYLMLNSHTSAAFRTHHFSLRVAILFILSLFIFSDENPVDSACGALHVFMWVWVIIFLNCQGCGSFSALCCHGWTNATCVELELVSKPGSLRMKSTSATKINFYLQLRASALLLASSLAPRVHILLTKTQPLNSAVIRKCGWVLLHSRNPSAVELDLDANEPVARILDALEMPESVSLHVVGVAAAVSLVPLPNPISLHIFFFSNRSAGRRCHDWQSAAVVQNALSKLAQQSIKHH
jgi:hypothetical protein